MSSGKWVQIVPIAAEASPDLLASCKELREALRMLMNAVYGTADGDQIVKQWKQLLTSQGIANGFGVRAEAAIAKAEGR